MHPDLVLAKEFIYEAFNFIYSDFLEEPESEEYAACTFSLNTVPVKFRVAKITPTKTGQFVTLWKRNKDGITEPHQDSDSIEIYVISVRKENHFGQFVFPKTALIKQAILSTDQKEGKRGFRVYPPWDLTVNKQAQKTQKWQNEFFLEISDRSSLTIERVNSLYSK